MADSESHSPAKNCPDTGQSTEAVVSDDASGTGEAVNVSSSCSSKNPFQPVKAAKFGSSINTAATMNNPFAARPTLKSDIVSTSGQTGVASPAKFILRPSALSAFPQNNRTDVSTVNTAVSSILKPAKLPDPTKPLEKGDSDGGEKENEEARISPPLPETQQHTDEHKEDNLFQTALKEHTTKKSADSSSSSLDKDSSNPSTTDSTDKILGENLTEKVTGVHTSPKGLVSSSGFVFGENLAERVQFKADKDDIPEEENNGEVDHENKNSADQAAAAENTKTLEESAREYQLTHGKKTELQEVEVFTGEENESNVIQANGKLFVFDGDTQNWIERGRGLLRLNDMRYESSPMFQSRLLMRTQGSLRLILNTKIWPGMNVERASQKSVRITGTDGDAVKVFLIITNPKDSENLLRALDWRVQQLRMRDDKHKETSTPEKRKAEPESPSEGTVVKKIKKSPEEESIIRTREESDSSVVDPETEVSSESQASSFTLRTDSD